MTVTLDLPPRLAGRVEAAARAQGRPVAELLLDAAADLYDVFTVPASDIADLRESLAEAERGERLDGPTVMREVFPELYGSAAA